MAERDSKMERALGAMRDTLESIANWGDCFYTDDSDRGLVCACPVCSARRTLDIETDWRVQGARHERIAHMPREAAIVAAWKRYVIDGSTRSQGSDHKLASILGEVSGEGLSGQTRILREPTPRDWYVASSMIQWIVTNVGSSLLYEAGYRYQPPAPRTERPSCKVCEVTANDQGEIHHGKGCYHLREDGGGVEQTDWRPI